MGLKIGVVVATAFAVLVADGVARADDDAAATTPTGPTGPEIGIRIGYSVPSGHASGAQTITVGGETLVGSGQSLSNIYSGGVPFTLDAGYRITPNIYVGAFFTYGILSINSGSSGTTLGASIGCNQGVSCSADEIDLGANVHIHGLPGHTLDPWVGLGFGYEWTMFHFSEDNQSGSGSIHGFEYFDVLVGLDILPDPNTAFAIGPFFSMSFGQYDTFSASAEGVSDSIDISNKALHEWFTFGVRGVYDVKL